MEVKTFFKELFTQISKKSKVETNFEFGYGCPMCKVLGDSCTHRFNREELELTIKSMREELLTLSKAIKDSDIVADVPLSIAEFKESFPKVELSYNEDYLIEHPSKQGEYFGKIKCSKDGKTILYKKMTCNKVYPSDEYPDGVYTESVKIWLSEAEYQELQKREEKGA